MNARRVLICGASGFLGRSTLSAMESRGWVVLGVGRSRMSDVGFAYRQSGELEKPSCIHSVFSEFLPTDIVFLAGPASVPRSFAEPEDDFGGHVRPLLSVLGAIRKSAPEARLLLISSAAVYGEPASLPIREDAALVPTSPYGFHKLIQETMVREYADLFGLRACVARVFSVFGPGQKKLAIWEMASRALTGDLSVRGDGGETRDYLYVDDVAQALATIVERSAFQGEIINVGSGRANMVRDVAAWLFDELGLEDSPRFVGEPIAGAPLHWQADVSKLKALGFEETIGLREGLKRTADWIRCHG